MKTPYTKICTTLVSIAFIISSMFPIHSKDLIILKRSSLRPISLHLSEQEEPLVPAEDEKISEKDFEDIKAYLSALQTWQEGDEIIIGVPKEVKSGENRVGITPQAIKDTLLEASKRGLKVRFLIEKDAGIESRYKDEDFTEQNISLRRVEICESAQDVWRRSHIIKKVKEPQKSEYDYIQRDQVIFTYFHFASNKELTQEMIKRGAICIAYETVAHEDDFPMLKPMSEIAGWEAGYIAATNILRIKPDDGAGNQCTIEPVSSADSLEHWMQLHIQHEGVQEYFRGLLGSESVTILGGGTVGRNAALVSLQMGLTTYITDTDPLKRQELQELFSSYGDKLRVVDARNKEAVLEACKKSGAIIGGVYVKGSKAPKILKKADLEQISESGPKIIVDVSIDQGGCIEFVDADNNVLEDVPNTTHAEPFIRDKYGNIRYHVPNMPSAARGFASTNLNKATTPYLKALIKGFGAAVDEKPELIGGFGIADGWLLDASVHKEHGDLKYAPIQDVSDTRKTVLAIGQEYFERMRIILGIDPSIAMIMETPEEYLDAVSEIIRDDGITPYRSSIIRSRNSTARGPAKGGIRRVEHKITSRDIENTKGLGNGMVYKCAGIGIPLGGAKGELEVYPDANLTTNEYARDVKEKMWKLMEKYNGTAVGEQIDIPAPDAGTGKTDMAYFEEVYLAWLLVNRGSLSNKDATDELLQDPDVRQALDFYKYDDARIRPKRDGDGALIPDTKTPILKKCAELEELGYVIQELAAFTDKPLDRGGDEVREEATGLGGYYAEVAAVEHYANQPCFAIFDEHEGVKGLRHALRGYGNVGAEYARICYENGGRFFAISNKISAIRYTGPSNGPGINIKELNAFIAKERKKIYDQALREAMQQNPGMDEQEKEDLRELILKEDIDLREYPQDNVGTLEAGVNIEEVKADVLVEAAMQCTLNATNADKVAAPMILELGNATTTRKADEKFAKKGTIVIPDILANSGGVVVSMYEAKQNLTGKRWPPELTRARLEERINRAMRDMFDLVQANARYNLGNRDAHYAIATKRVIDAIYARMWLAGDNPAIETIKPYATRINGLHTYPETDEELKLLCAKGSDALQSAIDADEVHRYSKIRDIIEQMNVHFLDNGVEDSKIKVCLIGGPTGYKISLAHSIQHILESDYGRDTVYVDLDSAHNRDKLPALAKGERVNIDVFDDDGSTTQVSKQLSPGDIIVVAGFLAIDNELLDSLPNRDACFPIAVDSLPCMKISLDNNRSVILTNDDVTLLRELLVSHFQRPGESNALRSFLSAIKHRDMAFKEDGGIYTTFRNRAMVVYDTHDPFELLYIRNDALQLLRQANVEALRILGRGGKGKPLPKMKEVVALTNHLLLILTRIPNPSGLQFTMSRHTPARQIQQIRDRHSVRRFVPDPRPWRNEPAAHPSLERAISSAA
ncbi:Glu/Leu/Phe/Val dehydrogenase dimerization domain-containing protein [Candidatus Omnitrophota bacterium]